MSFTACKASPACNLRASSPLVTRFPHGVGGCPNLLSRSSLSLLAFEPRSKGPVVLESQPPIVGDFRNPSRVQHLSILHINSKPTDLCGAQQSTKVNAEGWSELPVNPKPSGMPPPEVAIPNTYTLTHRAVPENSEALCEILIET